MQDERSREGAGAAGPDGAAAPEGATGRPHVVVVGAGIAGLAAALALLGRREAPRVSVLEGAAVIGGKLRVSEVAGIPVDEGAESLLASRPEAVDLARAVGWADRLATPAVTGAALWSRGRVRPLPAGLAMGIPTDLRAVAAADVLSVRSLLRLPLDHLLPRTRLEDDVAVGRFVATRLGPEVVDRLVEPLLGGVYAGRADALSMQATMPALFREARTQRSLLSAARQAASTGAAGSGARRGPAFMGVAGGVGSLPAAVAAAVRGLGGQVRTRCMVRELRRGEDGWRLTVGPARAPEAVAADAVILAVPAAAAARLLAVEVPAAARDLAGIDSASVAVITLGYPRAGFPQGRWGSGFLVPAAEGRAVKAATYSSDKWAWLGDAAAAGDVPLVLLRASLGRHGEEGVLQRDDDDLARLAQADLASALGISGAPVAVRVTRWGGALPQYAVGHVARVDRIRRAIEAAPGLAVCGAAYDGVGIAACVGSARGAATRAAAWLQSTGQWRHG